MLRIQEFLLIRARGTGRESARGPARERRWAIIFTGVASVLVLAMAAAWACTTNADMKLENAGNTTWDSGSSGLNYSECPLSEYSSSTHCKRPVNVTGTNFKNSDNTSIGSVDLYWIDEPFFWAGIGTQGAGQQVSGEVCRTKGVQVATGVSVNSSGSFSTQVNVPPTATTYADGTTRPQNAYYGANAICAVWSHGGHYSGLGNQYTIYPI